MALHTIAETDAEGTIKDDYQRLKKALSSFSLPLFFTYFGPFPEYLHYITLQIKENINNDYYVQLISQMHTGVLPEIKTLLTKSEQTMEWLYRYRTTPVFTSFQKDCSSIARTNLALAMIFIALRESAKGWALTQHILPSTKKTLQQEEANIYEERFILHDVIDEVGRTLATTQNALVHKGQNTLDRNVLVEYFRLCEMDFKNLQKKEYFLSLRVQLEKTMLSSLQSGPVLIFSPYNMIIEFTQKYDDFYEFLYIISHFFPTLAMQRLMFSGFMMI